MPISVHSLALQRAADLLGGKMRLRELLRVPMSELENWLAGAVAPPLDAFLKAVDVINSPQPPSTTVTLAAGPARVAIESALDAALQTTGARKGNVQLLYADGLRIVTQRGFARRFLDFFECVDDESSACGVAMKAGRRVVVADVRDEPMFAGAAAEVMARERVRSVQSTPIVGGSGKLLGVLSTHREAPGAPGAEALQALDRIVRRAARWLEAGT
jgi:GAF domain